MKSKTYLFSTFSHPDAISINSLDITLFKPDIDFSKYDHFIITSKQVSEVLKQYDAKVLKPALCISKATALAYEKIGGKVLGIGGGYGDDLSLEIRKQSRGVQWLYLRAKVVASGFVSLCKKEGYCITESIVYESKCSCEIRDIQVEDNATLIFTSPSSVKCFLKQHTISEQSSVIVIGKTTAKALPTNIEYKVSEKTTVQSCIDLVDL
ncbi:MAG: uroporphyrinogen-III synthase [Sulfurimonas sp.]|jgi:uroporphyrinogen-III synthase|uniref:uroporphyrinogen-III synthase n=1 Tax=Sulfurimonas sp. TaxID=2022749 RepID=UPI0039E42F23